MKSQYYVIVNYDTESAYYACNGENCVPQAFDTEAEAVEEAKSHGTTALVVKGAARVTLTTRSKVEKIK